MILLANGIFPKKRSKNKLREDTDKVMKKRISLVIGLVFTAGLLGCHGAPLIIIENIPKTEKQQSAGPDYSRPLPAGELALKKITDPAEIPDFTEACKDLSGLKEAIRYSLHYLAKPTSRSFFPYGDISHQHASDSLAAFLKLLDTGYTAKELNTMIRDQFDVYTSVGYDGRGAVLFTGYYTPTFHGSTQKTDRFRYPLYGQPDDLVKDPDGTTLGRKVGDDIVPYPAREEIERSGMLHGNEIMWLSDPFEVYTVQVQGSAKIRLPDGTLTGVGYTANNGHDYRSFAATMIRDGLIPREKMSLAAMIDYFKKHPDKVSGYTNMNPRFVFFRIEGGPPRGSINEPVTPLRSIATDKSIYPRACLTFLATALPKVGGQEITHTPYSGFALDQDAGGAIRAPGRCDIYIGEGDTAGKLAGQTHREGRLYYLFLKEPRGTREEPVKIMEETD